MPKYDVALAQTFTLMARNFSSQWYLLLEIEQGTIYPLSKTPCKMSWVTTSHRDGSYRIRRNTKPENNRGATLLVIDDGNVA